MRRKIQELDTDQLDNKLSISVPQFARITGISNSWARELIYRKEILASRTGRVWLISVEEARRWLAALPTNQAGTQQAAGATATSH